MSLFRSMEITASGMTAQRFRMDVISQNVANEDTTRTADGSPYRRRLAVFQSKESTDSFSNILSGFQTRTNAATGGGVHVVSVEEDNTTDFKLVYEPDHPDADEDGYVRYPNVDRERELTDMMSAVRSYEAGVTVLANFKNVAMKALEIHS